MAETLFRGPGVSIGSVMDGRVEPFDGPEVSYQGDSIPDPRVYPANKDGLSPGAIPSFFNSPYFVLSDGVPQKSSTTILAAAQVVTASTPMALATTQVAASGANVCQIAPGVPILPNAATAIVTTIAVDFGFATGTTVAASTTVTVVDNRIFQQGQWLVIGGVGNSAAQAPLFTQVAALSTNTTVMTITNAAQTGLSNTPIGAVPYYAGNLTPPGTQFGPPSWAPTVYSPYLVAGFAALFDPTQAVTRNVTVAAATVNGGTSALLVSGYDVFGYAMTELITASGTTVVAGKKAFKYIRSVTPQSNGSATYSVGLGDVFGINMRSDKWEYANIFYNGGFAVSNTGWTAAVTSVATNTTGDVRGAVNGSTLATIGTTANGTARLTIMMSVPLANMINATPLNSQSLFGVTQA